MSKKKAPTLEEIVLEDIIDTIDNPRYTDDLKYELIVMGIEIYKQTINKRNNK